MLTNSVIFIFAVVMLSAILVSQAGAKFGVPSLLLFLMVGMAFGTDGYGLEFNSSLVAQFIGMIALSVILFSGGLDTNFNDIRPVLPQGSILATLGVVMMAFATSGIIYFASELFSLGLTYGESLLMASIMSSTDSASVFSMLGNSRALKHNLKPLLEFESGSNDPMAAIMTIIVLDMVVDGGEIGVWNTLFRLVSQIAIGFASGVLCGKAIVWTLNKAKVNNTSLSSIMLLSFVFITFSMTDAIRGNGYLAVYIAGMVVGNTHNVFGRKGLSKSLDGYTWLVQIVMFIMLGLLVTPHKLLVPETAIMGVVVGLAMILVARPLTVFLCLAPFRKMPRKAKLYASWVGLRGAVPIILATYPLVAVGRGFNPEVADMIFNVVFFITILSLALQGSTVNYVADKLGLSMPMRTDSFGVDLPDNIKAALTELDVTETFLAGGATMREVTLPPNTLVLFVKRGDRYIVPKGATRLAVGDVLLLVWDDDRDVNEQLKELEIM